MNMYQIGINEIIYQTMIDEALRDDVSADGGWSIFAHYSTPYKPGAKDMNDAMMDDLQSKSSSNSSDTSEQCATELDISYF
jgi:hypothetical protein